MTKKGLIKELAEEAGVNMTTAELIYDGMWRRLAQTLRAGKAVSITHFGTFKPVNRRARKGRNPRTGAEIDIPERTAVTFKASKSLLMDEL